MIFLIYSYLTDVWARLSSVDFQLQSTQLSVPQKLQETTYTYPTFANQLRNCIVLLGRFL